MVVAEPLRVRAASPAALLVAVGCSAIVYAPCPVDVPGPMPASAFARCHEVLVARYGAIAEAEPIAFRLQTDWVAVDGEAAERRASVFRDRCGLAVVVEARWLREPWFALPHWGEVRADPVAERELADALVAALSAGR
jgi:hypothetical protein